MKRERIPQTGSTNATNNLSHSKTSTHQIINNKHGTPRQSLKGSMSLSSLNYNNINSNNSNTNNNPLTKTATWQAKIVTQRPHISIHKESYSKPYSLNEMEESEVFAHKKAQQEALKKLEEISNQHYGGTPALFQAVSLLIAQSSFFSSLLTFSLFSLSLFFFICFNFPSYLFDYFVCVDSYFSVCAVIVLLLCC